MIVSLRMRSIILILVIADMMAFSRLTLIPLIAMAIGGATILLGIVSSYRVASVLGLLVVITTAAASVELTSLLELGAIITAIVVLLLPILTLAWLALSAEEGDKQQVSIRRRPAIVALIFAIVCIWSAPLSVLVLSFFAPTVSMRVDILAEISIMLVATIAGAALSLRGKPTVVVLPKPEGGS